MNNKDNNTKESNEFSKMSISWDIGQYAKPLASLCK